MKNRIILPSLLFTILFTCLFATPAHSQDHSVMTYNIRYGTAKDGDDSWEYRKENMARELAFYEPDFIGVQEALHAQLEYLVEMLPQYSYIGVGRDDGKEKGEYSAILYHTGRLKLLKENTFWLSETPEKISTGWDAALPRIVTYGHFQYKKGKKKKIWYFNTHFDHRGDVAREKSVDLITQKVHELANAKEPVLISGDFNLKPDTSPMQKMAKSFHDSYTSSEIPPFGPSMSFQAFNIEATGDQRIDYIFTNDHIKVLKTAILSHWINGHFNSDHFPVLSYFRIK